MRPTKEYFTRPVISGSFFAMLAALTMQAAEPGPGTVIPWDWSGVIGTGQSLAVGEAGKPILSTNQPYHNLKLSTGQSAVAD